MDIMRMGDEPKYLGSWDLYELPGQKLQVTIKAIREEAVENTKGQKEKKAVMHFAEDVKPMILNIENKKRLTKLFGTKNDAALVGKRIVIGYEKVKAFGDIHDALRIVPKLLQQQAAQHIVTFKCDICKNDIQPASGMTSEQVAAYTKNKYGMALCASCASQKKKEQAKNEADA